MICKSADSYFITRSYEIVSEESKLIFLFVWLFLHLQFPFFRLFHGSRLLLELQPLHPHSHQQKGGRRKKGHGSSLPFSFTFLWPELKHMLLGWEAGEARKHWLYILEKWWILSLWEKREKGHWETWVSATRSQLPSTMGPLCGSVTPQNFYRFCRWCWPEVRDLC